MARMVPALPRQTLTGPDRDLVLAIEDQLEDTYVLFQPTPARGPVLVHPDEGIFVFVCIAGLHPQGTGWVDGAGQPVDPAAMAEAAESAFQALAGPAAEGCRGLVFVPDLPKSLAQPPIVAGMNPSAVADSVLAATRILKAPLPLESAGVERILQTLAPGVTAYVPDVVTDAQANWRTERHDLEIEASMAASAKRPSEEPDRAILKMIDACVIEALQGKTPWLFGLPMRESELSSPRHLLAPLIVAAAESWSPIVSARNGRGGFHAKLRSDEQSLLYFRVVEIIPSAPLLFFLPVVNLLRRSCVDDRCVLDGVVKTFRRWLIKHGREGVGADDIEVRIATSS